MQRKRVSRLRYPKTQAIFLFFSIYSKFFLAYGPIIMFGRFRNHVTKNNILRAYNTATAMLVLMDYYNNPNASTSEFFFDIGVHLLQAAISLDSSQQIKSASIIANSARIYSIFSNTI